MLACRFAADDNQTLGLFKQVKKGLKNKKIIYLGT